MMTAAASIVVRQGEKKWVEGEIGAEIYEHLFMTFSVILS